MSVRVDFVQRENGPARLVCEAEIVFEGDAALEGLKLVGFSLWTSVEGEVYVSFPSRAFGQNTDRRFFDYLRPTDSSSSAATKRLKAAILEAYRAKQERAK
jgi:hypothetical protein